MTDMNTEEFQFDLSGGRPPMDFANTLYSRVREVPRENLHRYEDLIVWAQQAGVLDRDLADRLAREGRRRPQAAAAVLEQAIVLREAIYRILMAVAEDQPVPADDLGILNAELARALSHARVVPTSDGFAWDWEDRPEALERVLWPVARSTAELLTSDELSRVRVCDHEQCLWLFVDESRNRSRQWCDMKTCGNRAKAKRHYQRRKVAS